MSYRALKHLVGETSLERKCRFIFGGFILILITASFYLYSRKTEAMVNDQNLNTCRLLVNPILLRHHWKTLETDPDFRPVIDTLYASFGEVAPNSEVKRYRSRFIKPGDQNRLPENEFEYEALEAFQKGDTERHRKSL